MQISPSYNTKLYLFALDIWTMCPRWRACTVYQCTSVPACQCARAEARVARMVTRSGLVYTWYWSAGQRSLRLYTATSHYTTTSPVSEQPASGQHRLACDKHLHSLRHVFMFSCIDCCCVMLSRTLAPFREEIVTGLVDWMCNTNTNPWWSCCLKWSFYWKVYMGQ